jgi:hypothetical protein
MSEEVVKQIDVIQSRFKEARIPAQTFETEDRATVAIVFERVNRKGVPLDTLQLLSAWTWSDEFDLQQEFSDLTSELEPFGFDEVGMDTNLLLRCSAAVLAADAAPETLVNLKGAEVRDRFEEVVNGIKGAIDFLRSNLHVYSLDNLPFQTFLVPLSVLFAVPANKSVQITDEQREMLVKWFWRSSFSKRYSSGVLRNLKTDIDEILRLKAGAKSELGEFPAPVDETFFLDNAFRVDSVNTKTLILLLANQRPLSFASGNPVSLAEVLRDHNRTEFHHLFPRAFLRDSKQDGEATNCLANFCFLSRADNATLGGVAPSKYLSKMPAEPKLGLVLKGALCSPILFEDDFKKFLEDRAGRLRTAASILTQYKDTARDRLFAAVKKVRLATDKIEVVGTRLPSDEEPMK